MGDRLVDMLRRADAAYGARQSIDAAEMAHVIADRAKLVQRRRSMIRSGAGVLCLLAAAGIGVITYRGSNRAAPPSLEITSIIDDGVGDEPVNTVASTLVEDIKRLSARTERLLALIDGTEARKAARRVSTARKSVFPTPTPKTRAAIAAETAARTMLLRGDLLRDSEGTRPEAKSAYQRVIQLFPESRAALDARTRLASLNVNNGGQT